MLATSKDLISLGDLKKKQKTLADLETQGWLKRLMKNNVKQTFLGNQLQQ